MAGAAAMTAASDWIGRVGDTWATQWRRTDRSFAGLTPALDRAVLAAAPEGAGRAVDLGCGAGATSLSLAARRPDLTVVGVDLSAELVRTAAARAQDCPNLTFAVADLNRDATSVAAGADLLVSRHGVMFFAEPRAVFADLRAAARPGARLVFSCFRAAALNPWSAALARAIGAPGGGPATGYAPGPFGFADRGWTAAMLDGAGWRGAVATAIDYDYAAGEGTDPVADAASFLARIGPVASALRAAADGERDAMQARLEAELDRHRVGDRVLFPAAAWIWSAAA